MNEKQLPGSLMELLAQLRAEGVPEWNYHRQISKYLSMKAREQGIPYTGTFELTPLCNLDCKMCYVHLQPEQMHGASLLSVAQWKDLMGQAADAGMRKARLTGGECLTYPGFDELYLYLHSRGVEVMVLTNGILLDEARIEFFRRHPPCEIQVTLYGSDEDAYERVTGRRMFRRVWENLQRADAAQLPLTLALTPSRFMEQDADALFDRAVSTGLAFTINTSLFDPRQDTGRTDGQSLDASMDTYLHLYKRHRALKQVEVIPVAECDLPAPNTTGAPRHGIRCAAGMGMFELNWTGEMFACTNLRAISARPLETGFAPAWQSIHAAAREYPVPAECGACAYAPMCVSCPAAHEQNGSSAHCNPVFCERIRRLVAEGIHKIP